MSIFCSEMFTFFICSMVSFALLKNYSETRYWFGSKKGNYFQNKFADRFVKNFGDSEKEIEALNQPKREFLRVGWHTK